MQRVRMADYVNGQIVREQSSGQRSKEDGLQTDRRLCRVFFLSFGLLCILQAALNVSLRLTLHSGQESRLDCNTTHSTGDKLPIDCEQLNTRYKKMTTECNSLQESFNALTREKNLLEDRISQLNNMKRQVEEERDRLKKRLKEEVPSGCVFGRRCPAGWREINSRCYLLSNETRTWQDSREDCLSKGADLVIINSRQEQNNLYRLDGDVDLLFWIGLSDTEGAGTFKWVDGSALTTPFWQSGQPDHGGPNNIEDCVEMYHRNPVLASWNDAPCGHKLRWLCERAACAVFQPITRPPK
uniref:uncharacterized protein n=1 Tax=Centroberyx gerrardi TaxID=166262 RepID=UPI003AAEB553